jgi:uncharacterized repeat protein (TIGR02543 family)
MRTRFNPRQPSRTPQTSHLTLESRTRIQHSESGATCFLLWLTLLFAVFARASPVSAQVVTSNPNLPPPGDYRSPDQVFVFATYQGPGIAIVLSSVQIQPFPDQAVRHASGTDEIEDFPAQLTGMISVNGSPFQPTQGTGPSRWIAYNKIGSATGTFSTEILALNLSANSPFGPFMLRESPTLASVGQSSITDLGGGLYRIDSFFDVFTELSVDQGNSWIPGVVPTHLVLTPPFALTVTTSGLGTVVKNPNQSGYDSNVVVTLTATANPGWTFTGWSGDATGMSNPLSVTMTNNKSITATFTNPVTIPRHTIAGGGGTSTGAVFAVRGTTANWMPAA